MFKDDLKAFVLANPNLVSMKETSVPGVFVLKYKKVVFFKGLWNDYLEECRGTLVDADFNVISRPFTKIYNYGIEEKAPILDPSTLVTAYRKVNGFMVAMTWYNNDILVSTTGSTDSPFVALAKEMMLKHACWEDWQMEICGAKGFTLMFECVHPSDPHIVDEKPGMYFLGWRECSWNSEVNGYGVDVSSHWRDYALSCLKCGYAESYLLPLGELLEKVKSARHEGYVFYTKDGVSSKIKSQWYLFNKFLARKTNMNDLVADKAREIFPEEYYPLIDKIKGDLLKFSELDEFGRLAYIKEYFNV